MKRTKDMSAIEREQEAQQQQQQGKEKEKKGMKQGKEKKGKKKKKRKKKRSRRKKKKGRRRGKREWRSMRTGRTEQQKKARARWRKRRRQRRKLEREMAAKEDEQHQPRKPSSTEQQLQQPGQPQQPQPQQQPLQQHEPKSPVRRGGQNRGSKRRAKERQDFAARVTAAGRHLTKAETRRFRKRAPSCWKLWDRVNRRVDDVHKKTAAALTDTHRVVLLPSFETQQMASRRGGRRINGTTAHRMLTWAHYQFRQRLLEAAEVRPWCQVVLVNEHYTTRCCGNCGHMHDSISGNKVFDCPNCHHITDRDWNAARNVLLLYLKSIGIPAMDEEPKTTTTTTTATTTATPSLRHCDAGDGSRAHARADASGTSRGLPSRAEQGEGPHTARPKLRRRPDNKKERREKCRSHLHTRADKQLPRLVLPRSTPFLPFHVHSLAPLKPQSNAGHGHAHTADGSLLERSHETIYCLADILITHTLHHR